MNTRCSSAPPSAKGGLVSLAGLLALLAAPLVQANTLNFVPDGNGAATPLFDPDLGTQVSPITNGNVVVLSGETLTINTTSGLISYIGNDSFSLGSCTGTTEAGANGSKQIVLFTFNNLTVNNGAIVNITGNRAVGLIARQSMSIDGTVNVAGHSAQNGYAAGGLASLGGYAGGSGSVETGAPGVAGGGVPGFGGTGGSTANGGGGGRGLTYTDDRLIDLLGGSGGGGGGATISAINLSHSGGGGGGGGGLLLLAQTSLTLGPNAAILAQGGSGGIGLRELSGDRAGGGGGGAGGSVVLCAPGIVLGGQINLAGGPGGTGLGAGNGFTGATGRLAIYSKSAPSGTAAITATRFDNATSAYPSSLLLNPTLNFVPDTAGVAAPLFDPDNGTLLSPATSGNVTVLNGETLTINSTTGSISKTGTNGFSGIGNLGITEAAANGSQQIALFTFNNLTVNSGAFVNITGTRAMGFIARNAITIDGRLYLFGKSDGGLACLGGYAGGAKSEVNGFPGGGVAGFGGTAGAGGAGASGGTGGLTYTDARLTDLLGGSGGGSGGAHDLSDLGPKSGGGGGGGGGLLLLAQTSLTLGPNTLILANGGAGGDGFAFEFVSDKAGGGGGGAGGSVVLCAPGIVLGGEIDLAGGRGGEGVNAGNGTPGATGRLAIYSKTAPMGAAAITATLFDNATAAYPAALELIKPSIVSITMDTTGNPILRLIGKGTPGGSYQLERSTDLETWTFDGSPRTATATGEINVTRTANPTLVKKLFYRLREL